MSLHNCSYFNSLSISHHPLRTSRLPQEDLRHAVIAPAPTWRNAAVQIIPANLDDIEWSRGINDKQGLYFRGDGVCKSMREGHVLLCLGFLFKTFSTEECGSGGYVEHDLLRSSFCHICERVQITYVLSSVGSVTGERGLRKKRKTTRCVCHPFIRVHKIFYIYHLSIIYIR